MSVLLLAAGPVSGAVAATDGTTAVGSGSGVFPAGTTFNGIALNGSTFGIGVLVNLDGSAVGDVEIVLAGTSSSGQPQYIAVEGKAATGSVNPDGSVTIGGTANVDMGDGTPGLPSVPFSVTLTTQGLQLAIGTVSLPTQTLSEGAVTIQ